MNNLQPETKITLPKGFFLGAASSAHQIEGNNTNSDWWAFEQQGRLPKSGIATDHYHRFEEDFLLAKQIGLNAMRISIEWSRIEPVEGKWNIEAIDHYKKVLRKLKELGMARMVTLHHFTLPQWLAKQGGFESKYAIQAFARYSWFIAANLGLDIDLWITINEPEVYNFMGYKLGVWPPFKKSNLKIWQVIKNLLAAHKAAYKAIHEVLPAALVGIAKNNVYYEPFRKDNIWDKAVVFFAKYLGNYYILDRIKNQLDFVGLNYYFYHSLKFDLKKFYREMNLEGPRSDMGWRTYPKGLFHLLLDLKKYNKPMFITENGIANARDDMRERFIREHLFWIQKARETGAEVRGYFYWSLTDTYEWHDGFNPKFGLIEVDFQTQRRRIRDSAKVFKLIVNSQ